MSEFKKTFLKYKKPLIKQSLLFVLYFMIIQVYISNTPKDIFFGLFWAVGLSVLIHIVLLVIIHFFRIKKDNAK
jgi:uncharacterized membrane protein